MPGHLGDSQAVLERQRQHPEADPGVARLDSEDGQHDQQPAACQRRREPVPGARHASEAGQQQRQPAGHVQRRRPVGQRGPTALLPPPAGALGPDRPRAWAWASGRPPRPPDARPPLRCASATSAEPTSSPVRRRNWGCRGPTAFDQPGQPEERPGRRRQRRERSRRCQRRVDEEARREVRHDPEAERREEPERAAQRQRERREQQRAPPPAERPDLLVGRRAERHGDGDPADHHVPRHRPREVAAQPAESPLSRWERAPG